MPDPVEIEMQKKLRALIPKFLERTAADVERLRAAVAAGDASTLAQIGHRLRGTAGSFGFPALEDIAQQLENAAKGGDAASFDRLVAALGDQLERAKIRYV